ncbi:MAG: nitrate reductase molybdenum cofactor assembly chaperone, partial [Alphaproteobacteria bacterium]
EHVHGESRDRGGAMVDLLGTYRAAGFEPSTGELPDHLPALLEFLATQPLDEAVAVLADAAHILSAVEVRLQRRGSAYAGVFQLLLDVVSAEKRQLGEEQRQLLDALLTEEDEDPNDLERLDAAWAETEVVFGPDPNAGCPAARDMLGRMSAPLNASFEPARAAK